MSNGITLQKKYAWEVLAGQIVVCKDDAGTATICMKVERKGLDFVRHYLVPVSPMPEGGPALEYLDPDDEVQFCEGQFHFALGETSEGGIEAGTVFINARGIYLKVGEHARFEGRKPDAYVDLATGEVRSRQEKKITAIHRDWRIDGVALGEDIIPLDALRG